MSRRTTAAAVTLGLATAAAVAVGASTTAPIAPPTAALSIAVDRHASDTEVAQARARLPRLRVAPDSPVGGYDREARFGRWPSIGGGCDLRDRVLADELTRVETRPGRACDVVGGQLDGQHVTSGEVDIDHVVPLRLAWASGAAGWTDTRRRQLASDRTNLRAERASSNRSDGAVGPEASDPGGDRCRYGVDFVIVVDRYGLTVTPARRAALERLVAGCPR